MKQIVIILVILLGPNLTLQAQKDTLKVKGEISLRGLWQTGTLNQLVVTPSAKLILENNRLHLEANSRYDFFLVNGMTIKSDLWSDLYAQLNPNKRFYPFMSGLAGFSQSFRMDYSTLIAVGVGTNVIKRKPNQYLQTNIGLGHFSLKYTQENAHYALSFAPMLKVRTPIFGKRLAFSMDLLGYLSFMDPNYYGLHNQISLHMFLAKGFRIDLNHTIIYNSVNSINIVPFNTKLLFGMTYSFA